MQHRAYLAVILGGQFVANLDVAIVNVAAPSIGASLHAGGAELQLVVTAYLLAYALALIPAARLGPVVGFRRLFLAGLAVFTLASAACGIAADITTLIAARVVQGLGGAVMVAQVLTGIRRTFAGETRTRAIGAYTMSLSAAAVVGQVAGGAIVAANVFGLTWRPLFLLNLPIGVTLVLGGLRALPRDGAVGAIDPRRAVGLDVSIFAVPAIARGIVALAGARATYFALLFVVALYVQVGRSASAVASGTTLVGWVAAYGLAGYLLPRLPRAFATRSAPGGALVMSVAFAGAALAAAFGTLLDLAVLLAIGGFGFGVMATATTAHVTAAVDERRAPDLSGVLATMVPISAVAGVATFGSAYLALVAHHPASTAFVIVCAAFAATMMGVTATVFPSTAGCAKHPDASAVLRP